MSSCNNKSTDFSNTKWIHDFGNGYVSYFIFKNVDYEFYDAEIGDTTYGTYYSKGDTIFINQTHGMYDDEFPEGSVHRTKKTTYQLLLINNKELGYLEQWNNNNHTWLNNFYYIKSPNSNDN